MNGMTTTAVCSPHPNPLPGGARGLLSARINLWGTLSPVGEGWGEGIKPHILQLRKYLTRCVDGVIDIFFAVRHGHKARFKR